MKMLLAGTMLAMMSVAALAEETPPVPAPQVVTCPYDLVPSIKEEVRQALGVIPCSLHGTTPVVANAQGGQAKIKSEGGHYYPRVTINGTPVRLMADTGATLLPSQQKTRGRLVLIRSLCNSHMRHTPQTDQYGPHG